LNDDPLQVYFRVGQKLNVTGTNIYDVIDEQRRKSRTSGTLMMNHIGGVMISVVGHGFETPSGQTKDYKIGISCFSTALRGKNKDWLA
jgi:hypothetical protein